MSNSELIAGETWPLIIARKLANGATQAGKIDWSTEPAAKGDARSTFEAHFEGRKYRVTVQDAGPEED